MKTIVLEFDTDGNSKTEGHGFKGKTCDEKMKAFEDGLGQVKKRVNKPEYNQTVNTANTQKVGT